MLGDSHLQPPLPMNALQIFNDVRFGVGQLLKFELRVTFGSQAGELGVFAFVDKFHSLAE